MTEAFGVAASGAGLASITIQILETIAQYFSHFRFADNRHRGINKSAPGANSRLLFQATMKRIAISIGVFTRRNMLVGIHSI